MDMQDPRIMALMQMMQGQGAGSPAGANVDPRLMTMQSMQPRAPAPDAAMKAMGGMADFTNPTPDGPPSVTTEQELEDVHSQMDQDAGAPMLSQAQNELVTALEDVNNDSERQELIDEFIQKYGEENLPDDV